MIPNKAFYAFVIPSQAGIQKRAIKSSYTGKFEDWIHAFAGMTGKK
jgi:hypothetical protein